MSKISPARYLATTAAIAELGCSINAVQTQHLPKNIKSAAEYLKEALAQFKEAELAARVIKQPMVGKVMSVKDLTKLVTKISQRLWKVKAHSPAQYAKSKDLETKDLFPCENSTGLIVKPSACKVVTFEFNTVDRDTLYFMEFLLMPGFVTVNWSTGKVDDSIEMVKNSNLAKALRPLLSPSYGL